MEKINKRRRKRFGIAIHPLFLLFAIYVACTGRIIPFLTYIIVTIMHEYGHAIYASKLGYKLNTILLMPYGAIVQGDIEGISLKDEIKLAFAGPLTNLFCAILFAALWWFFPDIYPYTELAFQASLTLCCINLIPAYSLDGGRILYATLAKLKNRKMAEIVTLISTCIVIVTITSLAIVNICLQKAFTMAALSAFLFVTFIIFGIFARKKVYYTRLYYTKNKAMAKGVEVKRIAILEETTIKQILQYLEAGRYLEIEVFDRQNNLTAILSEQEFFDILQRANIYQAISFYIK